MQYYSWQKRKVSWNEYSVKKIHHAVAVVRRLFQKKVHAVLLKRRKKRKNDSFFSYWFIPFLIIGKLERALELSPPGYTW